MISDISASIIYQQLNQSEFTWSDSNKGFIKTYTPPQGYAIAGFNGYFTNGRAILGTAYLTNNQRIVVLGISADLSIISSDYNFILYVILKKI